MQDKEKWHLVHNDNGEWISEENVVYLSELEAGILKATAGRQGKQLSIQHGPESSFWCYKRELEALETPPIDTEYKTLKIRKMEKKKESQLQLERLLGIDLPRHYGYSLDKKTGNLTLKVSDSGLKCNMQDDDAAFESWAIVLKHNCPEQIKTLTIDWDDLAEVDNLHYNRFVYRLTKFVQTYDWARASKPIPALPTTLVCNYPNGDASKKEDHKEGTEGWIECNFVEKEKDNFDVIDHQFPVGLFDSEVTRYTYFTTGRKSAIDIWAVKDDELFIFELKKPNNTPLGIISELMFYANVVDDLLSHRIIYKADKQMEKAIKKNYRGFGDFIRLYNGGNIKKINAVLLAENFHKQITPELLDFINDSDSFRNNHIFFTMRKI